MIGIIIPAYNEAATIKGLLHYLRLHSVRFLSEIIVVDGGSTERTKALLKIEPNSKIITLAIGRAKLMGILADLLEKRFGAKPEQLYNLYKRKIEY